MGADLDLIVYGATGFTGQLVAQHLAQRAHAAGVRWAVAGRSAERLAALCKALPPSSQPEVVVARLDDAAQVASFLGRTRAVITTAGPYQLAGEPLVAGCAALGVDYLDLCGEPAWMRAMIDRHEIQARRSGARILFSCGFDSLPFELGVHAVQEAVRRESGSPAPWVKGRVLAMEGGFSGGTAASSRASLAAAASDPAVRALLKDPFALTPGFRGPGQPTARRAEFDPDVQAWIGPFVMAPINTRNVHRSNMLMGHPYGRDFVYDEMSVTGPGAAGEDAARLLVERGASLGAADTLLPGDGPSSEARGAGRFELTFIAPLPGPRSVRATVKSNLDPGYGATSRMVVESALCLADAATPGGMWTPIAALGQRLRAPLATHAQVEVAEEICDRAAAKIGFSGAGA